MTGMNALLPADALKGVRLGLSISDSPDLARLGFGTGHVQLTFGEIARLILVGGGTIAYGGHLDPGGFTLFLMGEVERYGRRKDRPLLLCLAWQEHRRKSLTELKARQAALGLFGRIVCLDPDGREIAMDHDRGDDPVDEPDLTLRARALTAMRRHMKAVTHGRVLLGGRCAGFQGVLPGLMEEALLCLESPGDPQPLYLAGGFGGATAEIAAALGVTPADWLPPETGARPADPGLLQGRQQLALLARDAAWRGLNNGLGDAENRQLAVTHRPSEIATLVACGLGRRFTAPG